MRTCASLRFLPYVSIVFVAALWAGPSGCGGSNTCTPGQCQAGDPCTTAGECQSGVCLVLTCAAPSCNDVVRNGSETDVDCGGSCPACADHKHCDIPGDCESGTCDTGTCVPTSCADGVQNGGETDVDCGGAMCNPCALGQQCLHDSDCQSAACDAMICDVLPNLSAVSPALGPTGGGTVVTLTGQGFGDGQGLGVLFGVTPATLVMATAMTSATATSPAHPGSGKVDLTLINPAGRKAMLAGGFTYYYGTPALAAQVRYTLAAAMGIATIDVNRDRNLDLLVAGGNSLYLLIGNGDGTFKAGNVYAAGTGAVAVVGGDWNGDEFADVVVADSGGSGAINVLIGNGDGTLKKAVAYATGTAGVPQAIVAGDWNGDGKLDVATAHPASGYIAVYLGKGDGTFPAPVLYASAAPAGLVTADWNGDGKPDLVAANGSANGISLLLNKGDGTFLAAKTIAAGNTTSRVVAGDWNGDGKLDVAAVNAAGSVLNIFLGNGDGTFLAASNLAIGTAWAGLIAADINQDGRDDLVATSSTANTAALLLSNGDGTFQAQKTYACDKDPIAAVGGDWNGDGKPDVAVVNHNGINVSVLLNSSL